MARRGKAMGKGVGKPRGEGATGRESAEMRKMQRADGKSGMRATDGPEQDKRCGRSSNKRRRKRGEEKEIRPVRARSNRGAEQEGKGEKPGDEKAEKNRENGARGRRKNHRSPPAGRRPPARGVERERTGGRRRAKKSQPVYDGVRGGTKNPTSGAEQKGGEEREKG